jgi:ornithine cyclodeaminase
VVHLYDPDTGELLMIAESVLATMMRTAAAAAVGAKHLARPDAETAAVMGAGQLGRQCVRALATDRRYRKIYLSDIRHGQAQQVAAELAREVDAPVEAIEAESACRKADVICTATNSTEPVVMADWIRPGTHLSCMGADLPGKIECEMSLLPRCRIFADNPPECVNKGEVHRAVGQGILGKEPYAGSLGQVIIGKLEGRQNAEQITLFDGIGTGVQDTTVATSIYEQALEKKSGMRIRFL